MNTELRNVLISGSSKGLGKQIATLLREQGFRVLTMGYETPGDVDIRCNLLDLSTLKVELQKAFDRYGPIDILICNAGTGKKPNEITTKTEARRFFREKNFETARNLLSASIPFLKIPGASVVGISSIAALSRIKGSPSEYAAAKREMNLFFKEKALELGKFGIRVNLISPGNILFTGSRWEEISLNKPEFVKELLHEKVPLREFISPDEIASAILYLSSKSARNITGNNLVIDGGQIL